MVINSSGWRVETEARKALMVKVSILAASIQSITPSVGEITA